MPKPTPANLRRFAETPVVRRAINVVKDKIASMDWQVRVRRGYDGRGGGERGGDGLRVLRRCLEEPNVSDSFRVMWEQVLEDLLVGWIWGGGDGGDRRRSSAVSACGLWMERRSRWTAAWNGDPERARYAQTTGAGWGRTLTVSFPR